MNNFTTTQVWAVIVMLSLLVSACGGTKTSKTDSNANISTNDELISIRDFFKNPSKTSYQISPDGQYFSFLAPHEDRLNVHVQKIGTDEIQRITNESERDLAGYFWANNNRILYVKDDGGNENYKLLAVDKDGKNLKDLTPFDSTTLQLIDDLESLPNEIIIGINKRNKQVFDPYRLNIETGDMTMIAENPGNITGWMTDHAGKLRVAMVMDGVNSSLLYRSTEKETFKPILTTNFKERLSPLFFDFDNEKLYATSNIGRDKSAIVLYDPASAKEVEVLYEHPEVDVSALAYSRKRKKLTTVTYTTDKRQRHFFDKDAEALYARIDKELGDYETVIVDADKDENKFLVRTYSDRSRGAYYFYDRDTDVLQKLVDVSPWIDEAKMASMKPIQYKTRDGLTINGYLTLPVGVAPKNLPVVINPHGGPWARDNWGYNPEVQFLANRGYAVLQMNFRGSVGYGRKFWEASFKQWGLSMQDDISDGVDWLVKEGIANPDKIAIYGASYGGYATLMGIIKEPKRYACAIDYVGVSNMFTFMQTIPPYWEPMRQMFYEMVGNPAGDKDSVALAQVSPVFFANKIQTPLFVAQGANDPRVNKAESDQMVAALEKQGVKVEYMVKNNEGHGFRNEENRFEFYDKMEAFLLTYLK